MQSAHSGPVDRISCYISMLSLLQLTVAAGVKWRKTTAQETVQNVTTEECVKMNISTLHVYVGPQTYTLANGLYPLSQYV